MLSFLNVQKSLYKQSREHTIGVTGQSVNPLPGCGRCWQSVDKDNSTAYLEFWFSRWNVAMRFGCVERAAGTVRLRILPPALKKHEIIHKVYYNIRMIYLYNIHLIYLWDIHIYILSNIFLIYFVLFRTFYKNTHYSIILFTPCGSMIN